MLFTAYEFEYAACMLHLTHIDVARNLSSGALSTPESRRAEIRSRRPIACRVLNGAGIEPFH